MTHNLQVNPTEKLRMKKICFFNFPLIMNAIFKFLLLFLPQKLKDRIVHCSSVDQIYDFFPRSVMPDEIGGDVIITDNQANCYEFVKQMAEKVEKDFQYLKQWTTLESEL